MSFRDLKRDMRRKVHETLRLPAFYFPLGGPVKTDAFVRLIKNTYGFANPAQRQYGLASETTVNPKLLFMLDELDPDSDAIVSLAAGEAYRINAVDPPDDITVSAVVTALSTQDAAQYAYPNMPARSAAQTAAFHLTSSAAGVA